MVGGKFGAPIIGASSARRSAAHDETGGSPAGRRGSCNPQQEDFPASDDRQAFVRIWYQNLILCRCRRPETMFSKACSHFGNTQRFGFLLNDSAMLPPIFCNVTNN
jgi:hypothetical protein